MIVDRIIESRMTRVRVAPTMMPSIRKGSELAIGMAMIQPM